MELVDSKPRLYSLFGGVLPSGSCYGFCGSRNPLKGTSEERDSVADASCAVAILNFIRVRVVFAVYGGFCSRLC